MVVVKLAMMTMSALSGPTRRHHADDGDKQARSPGSAKETVKTTRVPEYRVIPVRPW
jgi:hypothetical protein